MNIKSIRRTITVSLLLTLLLSLFSVVYGQSVEETDAAGENPVVITDENPAGGGQHFS